MNIQCWFHIGSMGLITLLSKGFSRDFYSTTIWEQQFFYAQFSLWPNSHILTWLLKTTTTTITYLWLNTFFSQVMSLLFNTVSRFIISFLPRWLFSCSVVSNCWQPHWMQYSRLNCPFLSPRIWTNSCPNLHQKYITLKDEPPRLVCVQYATGKEWRNSSRKNEEVEQKQKQRPVVDVTGDERKVQSCTDQYCIGTWIVSFMSQGKLKVVKQEMERVNIDILGISERKWTRMGEFIQWSFIQWSFIQFIQWSFIRWSLYLLLWAGIT